MIGVSSIPKQIYFRLHQDVRTEDKHSALIKGYKKKFRRLAKMWLGERSITSDQHDEIIASVNSTSWRIWRPVLYVIPRQNIHPLRIVPVTRPGRAAYGPELQIVDLQRHEFDIIEI
jgi:hypothetical protein